MTIYNIRTVKKLTHNLYTENIWIKSLKALLAEEPGVRKDFY